MVIEKSTIRTEAIYSEDKSQRYLLRKEWDKNKPKAAIIMKNPSNAGELILDHTTMFVINNLVRLGYGSVDILNLYSRINGNNIAELEQDIEERETNNNYIQKSAERADIIILGWGSGCSTSKKATERQRAVLEILEKHRDKMVTIQGIKGKTAFHPLAPQVQKSWKLRKIAMISN